MAVAPLAIHLFGPLRVTVRGAPMPRVRTRSVEWLLALLALRHGRPIRRAWLAGTLWPESGESRALKNLRDDLMRLRQALGPEGERIHSPGRDLLTLDLADAEVDVLCYDAGIQAGDETSLREAVAVYTGPLLEGCVEEWALAERERRAEQCLTALEALAARAEERGDAREAMQYLRRAETMDPLHDSTQRGLMRLLAASGDAPAALLTYQEYRARLHREMNVEPEEETSRLFQEIRARAREAAAARPPHPVTPSPRLPAALPHPVTTLIGREEDVQTIADVMRRSRLVTLVGGGGMGKTRLAIQVAAGVTGDLAEGFPGRAAFVELAPLADPALLPAFVAASLGLHEEAAPQHVMQALIGWLSSEPMLLVLDNCEHLIQAAAELAQTLLEACPKLRILATSRQQLGVTGEIAWRVPSLPAPDPEPIPVDASSAVEHVLRFPAAQLLVERAAMARPGFRLRDRDDALAVARICHRLDGIPLAIELAAARVTVLPVVQIAARLDDRFRLLTAGGAWRAALPRHQTLRALIDWSYDQLPAAEARLLRQLAVFAGGWTLETAEAVGADEVPGARCQVPGRETAGGPASSETGTGHRAPGTDILDLLDSLVDRSLVLAEEVGGKLRYRMLETVREYGLEKLRECGEEEAARAAHLACFLRLAEEVGLDLRGPGPEAALTQLEVERDDLRAALQFSAECESSSPPPSPLSAPGSALPAGEAGLRLAAALWPFWEMRGYLSEGRQHLRAALQRSGQPNSPERAQAMLGAARLAIHQGDLDEADSFAQESLERFRAREDARGMAAALFCLGEAAVAQGEFPAAGSLFAEGLAACRQSGWTQGSAIALVKLGAIDMALGETSRARPLLEEGRVLAETLGDAPTLALSFHELGSLAEREGDDARAGALLEQSLEIWRRLGHKRATADTLAALARLARSQGDPTRAISFLEQAAATCGELGDRMNLAWRLLELGNVRYAAAAYALARAAYEEGLGYFQGLDYAHGIACASNNLGMACFHLDDPVRAQELHREALRIYQRRETAEGIVWSLERLGVVEARRGDARKAILLLAAASAAREGLGIPMAWRDQADGDQAVAFLRAGQKSQEFDAAWAEGRALPPAEAICVALDENEIANRDPKRS